MDWFTDDQFAGGLMTETVSYATGGGALYTTFLLPIRWHGTPHTHLYWRSYFFLILARHSQNFGAAHTKTVFWQVVTVDPDISWPADAFTARTSHRFSSLSDGEPHFYVTGSRA